MMDMPEEKTVARVSASHTGFSPRVHVWILVGKANSRKSSTIRALTGHHRESALEIARVDGQIMPFYTIIKPLNELEGPPSPSEVTDYLVQAASEIMSGSENVEVVSQRINLLVALTMNGPTPGKSVADYLNAFVAAGWHMESVVTLGEPTPAWIKSYGAPYADVSLLNAPNNAIAHDIRQLWGWL